MACHTLALFLLMLASAHAQGSDQATAQAQAAAACTTSAWETFWPTIRDAGPIERRRITLPDMAGTSARIMPDGIAQRIRIEGSFVPSAQYMAVWLYPAPERIAGSGRDAVTAAGEQGARLAVSVPQQPADAPAAWDATITIPTVGSAALPKRGWLTQNATLVVLGCSRGSNRPDFLATTEFVVSDGRVARLAAGGVVLLIYVVAAWVAATGRRSQADAPRPGSIAALNPIVVTQDGAGHGSVSRLQILFFTLIVVGTLFYLFLRTGVVANLSADLLWLLGISGAGTVLAQTVSSNRAPHGSVAPAALTWLAAHGVLREERMPRVRDLFFSGGEFDIYRLQNLVFSPFVGLTVLAAGVTDLAALDIPDNLMALLGLSQVVYVGGKAVQPAPTAEAISAAIETAAVAEAGLQRAYDATIAAQGNAADLAAALERVPAEALSYRTLARAAADAFARGHDEDLQLRTPHPVLRL